ncbi:thioredoxin-like domain-containing protein [Coprobacter tertius]|uniref:Thioredoxin-like domain-containing protein n=1 Tax=Coprobacter tertius TaxID=2944915 RepID=A0ABT1MDC1_9BACT|nr:thioredoxin-like domain-containing protein [Coprobacter tertius]MCP9610639.1 thioredoxin-like domain-containing protein [Coprobacter tertius]
MKKYSILFIFGILLCSCHNDKFTVKGTISGADGKTLYLEASEITRNLILDSVKLDAGGEYKFSAPAPQYPEFYRLRIGNAHIDFSVDSTETVTIDSQFPGFASDYRVSGSESSEKMKIVSQASQALKEKTDKAMVDMKMPGVDQRLITEKFLDDIADYKKEMNQILYSNPRSAVAYYIIFQQIDGKSIYDPYDKEDSKAIRAVATQYDFFYKESVRAKQLHKMAIEALAEMRAAENSIRVDTTSGAIDISLPDEYGHIQKLSSLKGNVVLLDFTAYQTDYSPQYNITLANIYKKYKDKGFEIYQVSLDNDENFWKVSASNLPWISVWDADSQSSRNAALYNVQKLPTSFLLDRNGSIKTRVESMKSLENEIKKLL